MPQKLILSEEKETAICNAYLSGSTSLEIARLYRHGVAAICKVLQKYNVYAKYNELRKNRICSLYLGGMPVDEIAKLEKIGNSLMSKYLKENNIQLRHYRKHAKLTEKDEKEIVRLYIEEGWTKNDVARKFRFNEKRLNAILKKHGFSIRKSSDLLKQIKTKEQENEILDGIKEGKSIADIVSSLSFECSYLVVNRFINAKLPVKSRSIKERRKARYSEENCEKLTTEWGERSKTQMLELFSPSGRKFGTSKPIICYGGKGYTGYYKGIFFRSLKELTYMLYLDENNIKWLSGEEIELKIQYTDETGKVRFYWPDFLVENTKIVEIKPKYFQGTIRVQKKTEAAINYCLKNNMQYEITDFEMDKDKILKAIESNLVEFSPSELMEVFLRRKKN